MSLFKRLFYNDTTSVQDKVNEDVEGVGGEIYVPDTDKTTNEKE